MASTIDAKKEEFRNYLDKGGVVDALTKALVGLFEEPEKPANPIEFLTQHFSPTDSSGTDIEALIKENEDLKAEKEEMLARIHELEKQLEQSASGAAAEEEQAEE
eukprot:m.39807 g.39807  ORF g.39807 m.39807 type:complete len:105 (-) comp10360_c0_seq1:60-374(-)